MESKEKFRISSFLKDLIGRELITDEFVAVFELVKNSFDANAKCVQIIFENQHNIKASKIIIRDDGKGMNNDDLKDKWLFVAYSEKRNITKDMDYRDKIQNKRVFAGAKGVGRFSCDRLGRYLNLMTLKHEKNAKIESLIIDWTSFEEDANKEFVNINVTHKVLRVTSYKGFTHGTILEITGLRDVWDRKRLQQLKFSLEKLINPIQKNDTSNFNIEIIAEDELANDEAEKDERKKVNGLIRNIVFDRLGIKTTEVKVDIIEDSKIIKTTLIDRGRMIYELKEKNTYNLLSNISISLFVLNRSAKINFKKIMNIDSVAYGSVFMYKNGFRIYPFGEETDDTLGIGRRKQQGIWKNLGSRELIGRIEINGENPKLKETTSRDGGLIKNDTYKQLIDFFYEKALKRLEKYTVDIIKFGDDREDKETGEIQKALNPEDVKSEIFDIIASLTKANNVIDIQYDKDFLQIYEAKKEKSASQLVRNFTRIAAQTNNPELIKQAKKAEQQVKQLIQAKNEAEREADDNKNQKIVAEKKLKQVVTENLFLRSDVGTEKKTLISLYHHITHTSNTISVLSLNAIKAIEAEDKKAALSLLNSISFENKKIATLSNFVSKAKFDAKDEFIKGDIVGFVNEYVKNVYSLPSENSKKPDLKVEINPTNVRFNMKFMPIEVIIIIDNLLSNSKKAGASIVKIFWENYSNGVKIHFQDNGSGIANNILSRIYNYRYSNTKGGGLGLFHVKEIVDKMKWHIDVNNKLKEGVDFILTLPKETRRK
jgi:signal transduction histidine kinase